MEVPKPKAPNTPSMVPVEFEVYGQGTKSNMAISFAFTSKDHSFTIDNVDTSNTTSKRTINVKPNVDYKVTSIMTGNKTYVSKPPSKKETRHPIEIAAPGTSG